jgi:hypothetical protein
MAETDVPVPFSRAVSRRYSRIAQPSAIAFGLVHGLKE